MSSVPALIERIRSEYLALPGLKLSEAQARRLWPATDDALHAAIAALIDEGFLRYLPSGTYVAVPRPHGAVAKADVAPRATHASVRCPHCHKLNSTWRDVADVAFRGPNASLTIRCEACGRVMSITALSA
jgi:hypothetical protein